MPQPTAPCPEFELLESGDVRERDIDLLLREELFVSEEFQHFFFSLIAEKLRQKAPNSLQGEKLRNAVFARARHSVDRYAGESDLEVDLKSSGQTIRLLIEDKIDAEFQNGQAERYTKAGDDYVSKLECREFFTVLVAPDTYLGGSGHGFDVAIPLESILDWFERDSKPRSQYKASLLKSALQKRRIEPPPDPGITRFWSEYYNLANKVAKVLAMKPPGGRRGGFLYFNPGQKPRYVDLVHKLNKGYVDLQFAIVKSAFGEFDTRVRHFKEREMFIHKTGNSVSVGIWVGELATNEDFSMQRQTAENGIRAAEKLWEWFQRNKTKIEGIYLDLAKQNSSGNASKP